MRSASLLLSHFFDGGKLPLTLILEMNRSLKGHTDSWRQEGRGMGRDQLRMGRLTVDLTRIANNTLKTKV